MSRASPRARLLRQVISLLVVVSGTITLLTLGSYRMRYPSREPSRTWIDDPAFASAEFVETCGRGDEAPHVEVIVSPEKWEWVLAASEAYMEQCAQTRINLIPHTDIDAIRKIERGELEPALWLASDTMFADYFSEGWSGAGSLERGPSLLHTPLVLLMWSSRAEALDELWPTALDAPSFISEFMCPGVPAFADERPMSAATWSAWSQREAEEGMTMPSRFDSELLADWGAVEFDYTQPTVQPTGFAVLLAAVYGNLLRVGHDPKDRAGFEYAIEHTPQVEDWLEQCYGLGNVPTLTHPRNMARHMYLDGEDGTDAALVYEHVAINLVENDPRLRILYPRFIHTSDHPSVLFPTSTHQSAKKFLEFLATEKIQRAAILHGLRPARLDRSLPSLALEYRESPLVKAVRQGAQLQIDEQIGELPRVGRDAMHELFHIWAQATGHY